MTATVGHAPSRHGVPLNGESGRQRAGGVAALYLALALLAAIPYFLLVVDYPSAETAADKVALVADSYASMYAVYLATYIMFGLAVGVLALSMYHRFAPSAGFTMQLATAVGLLWSFVLVASGLVFTYGMTTVVDLHDASPTRAAQTWQGVELVAMALGGAGGELLGGAWLLLLVRRRAARRRASSSHRLARDRDRGHRTGLRGPTAARRDHRVRAPADRVVPFRRLAAAASESRSVIP